MAQTITLKRSSVAGRAPTTVDLSLGEIAINTFDGVVYIKKNNGTESIVSLREITENTLVIDSSGLSNSSSGTLAGVLSDLDSAITAAGGGTFVTTNTAQTISGQKTFTGGVLANSIQVTGGTGTQGTVTWNSDEETLDLIQNGSTLQLGQEVHYHVRNNTAALIPNGTPVMATGTIGESSRITIAPMDGTNVANSKFFLGFTTTDIAADSDGKVTHFGKIRGINTSAYALGTVLYISTTVVGGVTTTEPVAGMKLPVAFVINSHASVGAIFVRATNGSSMADLHDVNEAGLANGNLLRYESATNQWKPIASTTTNITEGTNLYYTTARANSAIDARVTKTFVDALGVRAATADKLTTARTISLTGDVTGSVSFDGSANASITAVVQDDSHNHIISNVDGLQTELDSKIKYSDVIMNTNPFGGKKLYINSINDAMFRAADRWIVSGTIRNKSDDSLVSTVSGSSLKPLFDGSYETRVIVPAGTYLTVNINFNGGNFPGYPYGNLYISHYYTEFSESATLRVYSNYEPHGIGWHEFTFSTFVESFGAQILKAYNNKFAISEMEFIIRASDTASAGVTAIDYQLDRPGTNEMPLLDKYKTNILYDSLLFRSGTATNNVTINNLGIVESTGSHRAPIFYDSNNTAYYTDPASTSNLLGLTVTNTITGSISGNAGTATKLATPRTISLAGDVTGSVSFDGSANVSITATVADDSHNHIISNVDGLQTALNLKAPLASPALTGVPTAPTATAGTNTTQIATTAYVQTAVSSLVDSAPGTLDTLNELAAALGDDPNFATTVTNNIATKVSKSGDTMTGNLTFTGGNGIYGGVSASQARIWAYNAAASGFGIYYTEGSPDNLRFDVSGNAQTGTPDLELTPDTLKVNGNTVFHDGYHPNADTLTTARNIALTGAVTGNANFDGSGNISITTTATNDPTLTINGDASGSATFTNLGNATLTLTVADDSHNHVISNVDGLQTALNGKQPVGNYVTTDTTQTITATKTFNSLIATTIDVGTITSTESATLATVTQTQIASFAAASYGSAKFLVQATRGTARHITEVLVVHDGTTASATEYGTVVTSTPLFTLDVDISSGNVRLLAISTTTDSTSYKVYETLMKA